MSISYHAILNQSFRFGLLTLLLFGFGYASLGVGLGQFLLPKQANGSLIFNNGQAIGSTLVAQPFVSDAYFHSRPSAANFDVMAVAGSNQAQSNPALQERIQARMEEAKKLEAIGPIPSDFLTQSGSGIDPHISVANANLQLPRISKARGMSPEEVKSLLQRHTQGKQLGLLGQERVNVLELNLALDKLTSQQVAK